MARTSPRGSEWRKWDLHAHSPASHGFSGSWDQFETQLKNADCEVIGINDYFSVAGYKRTRERIDSGDLDIGNKAILPVVEFRMRDVLQNRHANTGVNINFHVVFDSAIQATKIETFLRSLEVDGAQIADNYDDSKYLRETAKVYMEKDVVGKLVDNPDFKDKFLVMLPYDEYGGIGDIDPETDDWVKRGFIRKAHILGSSNRNQIDFFLWRSPKNDEGKDKFSIEQFAKWFASKKPCIKGSDSHDHTYPIGRLRDRDSNAIQKYCWVKAEPTFEGLKQIVFDPESRVAIGEQQPVEPTNVIEHMTFNIPPGAQVSVIQDDNTSKDEPFCFGGVKGTYSFSPYFNCFIGGRGSGKSTILNFLGQYASDPSSSRSFWERLQPTFDTLDPSIFSFDGVERFEFIGQSEVESFATDKEVFTAAIYERADILSEGRLAENETALREHLKSIRGFESVVENTRAALDAQAKQTKEKKTLEQSKKIIESKDYADVVALIAQKSADRQDLASWRSAIWSLRESLLALAQEHRIPEDLVDEDGDAASTESREEDSPAEEYTEAHANALATIDSILVSLDASNFEHLATREGTLHGEIEKHEEELSSLLQNAGLSPENIIQAKSATQQLVRIDDELKKRQRRIDELTKALGEYSDTLGRANTLKAEYESVITAAIQPLAKTLEDQVSNSEGEDIKAIGLTYFFDEARAWQDIADETYKKFAADHGDGARPDMVKSYIVENRSMFTKTHTDIANELEKEPNQAGYLRFLRDVFSDDLKYREFCIVRDARMNDVATYKRIQVLYDGRDIERASFGQKCTSVMVILLLFGNYPLIIDEPEAHLDSALIANYLVPLIKRKKTNRQIFFATHNANFVINGDAEKIFILSNTTGVTEITETTIEDVDNRDRLLKLEGGREAFRKRGAKLHIQ